MKTITLNSIHKTIIIILFFSLGNGYSQTSNPTLFGQKVNPESSNPKTHQIRCASVEYEKYLQQKNPNRTTDAQFEAWLAPLVKKYQHLRTTSKMAATVITIPVVIHVIHNGQTIGTAPNITDNQAQSQITVLNQDYRKMLGTPGYNTNPVGADIEIEFTLAQQDPNGNPTNGIDRVNFCQSSWSEEEIESTVKPNTIWDPTQYLNMWTVEFSNSTLLGYAQSPDGSGLPGLSSTGGPATTDGVVSRYNAFGSKTYDDGTFLLDATYNKGRTMTHEVGHWLGLRHIWGDSPCGDDYCADTPVHHDANYGCPTTILSCNSTTVFEMVQNYMDYTDDACMNIFTQNQKDRIIVIMNNAARRSSLKTSTKATAVSLVANDAEIKIEASNCSIDYGCSTPPPPSNKQVSIYNRGTSTLTSATLNYTINGGPNQVHNWTGTLAQNKSTVVTLLNTNSYGALNVSVATANGVTDQRSSNNNATATFTVPTIPTNYAFNSFVFTLQQDKWGSETTWSLKNGSGTTLYSGGPYADSTTLPALLTFNWTLTNNQCYTFTINDSQGDGICCGTTSPENGYYSLKSTNGSTTVLEGTDFGYGDTKSFSIGTLGANEFETSTGIYLYPNPTKGTLNIQIPSNLGMPNSYTINNALGQKIIQKEISKVADLTINTTALSKGIYFITLSKEDQKRTLRFIKE